jgi:threonine/homoserine/homoserine lactone efflux protein
MISTELTFALVSFYFVMFVTPGPNNIMLFASGVKYGFKKTIPHILGIPLGHFVQISLVSLGLGFVFQAYPMVQQVLKIIGCLYLFFLAYRMFGSLNMKAWVIAITVVSVFFPKDENFITGLLFLTCIAPIVNLPSISIWVLFGSSIRVLISNPAVKKTIEVILAVLLVGTGLMILI